MSSSDIFIRGKVLSGRVYPEFFPFSKTDKVLNIGCGYGPQAISYQGHFERMIGIDISENRLQQSLQLKPSQNMGEYHPLVGNVEKLPFPNAYFDKIIAIDIIEHVENPVILCQEIQRVLKPDGLALISFPALHDKYVEAISWFARNILRRKSQGTFHDVSETWNPDAHNQSYTLGEWQELVEKVGLKYIESRATTLFPPLHLYGVPRFWFQNELIHQIDKNLCANPLLKNWGQALMVIFKRA